MVAPNLIVWSVQTRVLLYQVVVDVYAQMVISLIQLSQVASPVTLVAQLVMGALNFIA